MDAGTSAFAAADASGRAAGIAAGLPGASEAAAEIFGEALTPAFTGLAAGLVTGFDVNAGLKTGALFPAPDIGLAAATVGPDEALTLTPVRGIAVLPIPTDFAAGGRLRTGAAAGFAGETIVARVATALRAGIPA